MFLSTNFLDDQECFLLNISILLILTIHVLLDEIFPFWSIMYEVLFLYPKMDFDEQRYVCISFWGKEIPCEIFTGKKLYKAELWILYRKYPCRNARMRFKSIMYDRG